jgi:ubiquinone/menaquinone biosynthesis C-methylase UbiE
MSKNKANIGLAGKLTRHQSKDQFAYPTGIVGWLVGYILAISTRKRSLVVLSQLDIQPDDRVLEIGFGPGLDIRRASSKAWNGFVAGIDISKVMLGQARHRNKRAIRSGKVELRLGSMDLPLPYPADSFSKVFAINSFQFWGEPDKALLEIKRVLKPGGQLLIAVQPMSKGATEQTALAISEKLQALFEKAGFKKVQVVVVPLRPTPVASVSGEN